MMYRLNHRFARTAVLLVLVSLSTFAPLAASAGSGAAVPSVSTISGIFYPISLGYNPSNAYVYVGSFDGSVSVISGTKLVGNISSNQVGYSALSFAYDQHNQAVYVAGGSGVSTISGLNAVAGIPTAGATPQTLMYDPSNDYMFVGNLGWIAVLTSNGDLKGAIPVNQRPGGFVFDAFDNYTYANYLVQNAKGVETGAVVYAFYGTDIAGNVTLDGGRGGLVAPVYDACHDYVYVANTSVGSVSVIWGAAIIGDVPVGQEPAALAYNALNHYVYVANYNAGTVSILSGASIVGNVQVGASPIAVAYNPYDGNMYVANEGSGTISVISGSTVVATVPVGRSPAALVYNASNHDIYLANNGGGSVSLVTPQGQSGPGTNALCSPKPVGLVTTTTTTATTTITNTATTTLTATTTSTATSTTTRNNTVTITVTKVGTGVPPTTTTSSGSGPVTMASTTTVYLTSTLVSTQRQSNATSSTAG